MSRKLSFLGMCILAISSVVGSASATCYFTNLCDGSADSPTWGQDCSSPLHSTRGSGNGTADLITDDYDLSTFAWYSLRTKLVEYEPMNGNIVKCDYSFSNQISCSKTDCLDPYTVYGSCSTNNCECLHGTQDRTEFNVGVHSLVRGGPYSWTNYIGSWVGQPY